jgi:hypothetical protein
MSLIKLPILAAVKQSFFWWSFIDKVRNAL